MGLRDINYLHKTEGTSLAVQWLGLCTFTVGVVGSIPGQGTKIPHATGVGKNKILFYNKFKGSKSMKMLNPCVTHLKLK